MEALLTVLPPEVTQAVVTFVAFVTALRALAVWLQRLAAKTPSAQDDRIMARVVSVLSFAERALDWVSIGPTARTREAKRDATE